MAKEIVSPDIARLLSKSLLFGVLDESARRELTNHVHRKTFNSGEPIFHVGDPGQSMMVILVGTVVNLASRLCGDATDGQILVDSRVRAAVEVFATIEPIGALTFKGFNRPVKAFSVQGLEGA